MMSSSFVQSGGQLQLHHCSASNKGGGFFLKKGKFEVLGTTLVDMCTATSGGGIFLEDCRQFHVHENITFSKCRQVGTLSGFGGGLEVHNSDIVQSGGAVVFLSIAIVNSKLMFLVLPTQTCGCFLRMCLCLPVFATQFPL